MNQHDAEYNELDERIITLFHRSIESKMQSGEVLAPLLTEASQILVHALLNENKILACGNGISGANAQILTANLSHRFERERPPFPAFTLGSDFVSQTAIANDVSYNEVFAKQIRALGNPGDILILFSTSGNPSNLVQALQAAHEKQMPVIAITGRDGGNIAALLDVNDLELRVPDNSRTRIHEVHLLINFCLCDLIDYQLFGAKE